jgi:hypothetical protein
LADFATPTTSAVGSNAQQALGSFSELLGDLIAGSTDGTGARVQPSPNSTVQKNRNGAGAKQSRVEIDGSARLESVRGTRHLVVPFRIIPAKGANHVRVRALPVTLLEQGTEKEPPQGASTPAVQSFSIMQNGREQALPTSNGEVTITVTKARDSFFVRISVPDGTRVRVDLSVVP